MKKLFITLSVISAAVAYMFLFLPVVRGNSNQSFATWALWGILDLITFVSVVRQRGNWYILGFYVLGSVVISCGLIYAHQFSWSWFETLIVILVGICLLVWYILGDKATTIAGTIAIIIATIPQLWVSTLKPNNAIVGIWVGFTVANALSFLGGKKWSIAERLYPGVCTVLTLILVLVNLR